MPYDTSKDSPLYKAAFEVWRGALNQPPERFDAAWARSRRAIERADRMADERAQREYLRMISGQSGHPANWILSKPHRDKLLPEYQTHQNIAVIGALGKQIFPPWHVRVYRRALVRVLRAVTAAVRSFTRRPRKA